MKNEISIVLILLLIGSCSKYCDGSHNSPLYMMTLIRRAGYSPQIHKVSTEDGYLLSIFRIPGPPGSRPVFLQHGFLGNSDQWVVIKNTSLAFFLANLNYDVWFGNFRSTKYGSHKVLSKSDSKYWDFSFHELGFYDLYAMINYVTNYTRQKITYVGYSMGSTTFFVMASERHKIASKIRTSIVLGPVVFMTHFERESVKYLFASSRITSLLLGNKEYRGGKKLLYLPGGSYIRNYCNCGNFFSNRIYFDLPEVRKFMTSTTSSVKTLIHFVQHIGTEEFRKFDYGSENRKFYVLSKPYHYNLGKIQIPVIMFVSKGDPVSTVEDAKQLKEILPNKDNKLIILEKFCHFDFLWSNNLPKLIFKKVKIIMEASEESTEN